MADTTENVAPDNEALIQRQAQASALIGMAIGDDDEDSLGYHEGDQVGRYTLVNVLGRGGFGVVWLARQTEPIVRDVALKIILPGMDSRAVVSRFRAERQALARMAHPNIATVLDADTTEDSLPYFVMELVCGEPITDYAKTHRLGVREIIAMFLDVCSAVQHAHQRAILHRDLKPSNLLVAHSSKGPVPKVIDFGIAKALTGEAADMPSMAFTMQGQMIGTPQYMAPEHALLGSDQVDVRADVFSLGAILYELLTGRPQLETDETRPTSAKDLFNRVCKVDPVKPSTRVRQILRASPGAVVPVTQVDPELDWLVLKALERSPDDRYPSVDALAADLQRYLNFEPLSVGPPSFSYRLRKQIRKNRAAFILGGVVAVSLILVAAISLFAYARESRARTVAEELRQNAQRSGQQALEESHKATQLAAFLSDLLDHAGKNIESGKNPEALRLALDQSTREIDRFAGQPDLQASLCQSLAKVFESMGDFARALPLRERQHRIYQQQFGVDSYKTLEVKLMIAADDSKSSRTFDNAIAIAREVCASLEAQNRSSSPAWFEARQLIAFNLVRAQRSEEAMTVAQDLMGRRNGRGVPSTERISFLKALSEMYRTSGNMDEAERTLTLGLDQLPDDNTSYSTMHQRASLLRNLSRIDAQRGQVDEAIQHLGEAVNLDKVAKGPRHQILINMLIELARHYGTARKADDAARATTEALSIANETGDIPQQIHATRASAEVLEQGGRHDEALVFRRQCESLSKDHSRERDDWMEDLRTLTRLLTRLQKHEEAEQKACDLWTAMKTYPHLLGDDVEFARGFYQTLIETCEAWQAATGSHAHDADIEGWKEALKALKQSSTPVQKREDRTRELDTDSILP